MNPLPRQRLIFGRSGPRPRSSEFVLGARSVTMMTIDKGVRFHVSPKKRRLRSRLAFRAAGHSTLIQLVDRPER